VAFYSCRVTKYQDDLRDMVLETAERLEDQGPEEFLKGMD
jgi:phosphoribosylaminoimidazole carboxylase